MDNREVKFGTIRLTPDGSVFFSGDHRVRLTRRLYRLLLELISANGEVVPKEELLVRCWSREDASEHNLTRAISHLRAIFQTRGEDPIESVYGYGYRLKQPSPADAHGETEATTSHRRAEALSKEAWYRLYQRRTRSLTAAEQMFRQAEEQDPNLIEAWLGTAEIRLIAVQWRYPHGTGTLQEIRSAIDQVLTIDPNNADARAYLSAAMAWLQLDFGEAKNLLSEALKIDPEGYRSNKFTGWYLLTVCRPAEAEIYFRRALEANPASSGAVGGIILSLLCSDQGPEALAAARSFCLQDVENTVTTGCLALTESTLGNAHEGLAAARKFHGLMPESSIANATLAYALARANEMREAVELLERLTSPSSGFVPTAMVCPAWLAVGERARALGSLEQALPARCPWLPVMLQDARNAELRDTTTYQQLLARYKPTAREPTKG